MDNRITFEIIALRPNFVSLFNAYALEHAPLPELIPEEIRSLMNKHEQKHTPANLSNFDVYLSLESVYSAVHSSGKRPLPSDVCEYESPRKALAYFNDLISKISDKFKDSNHLNSCPICNATYHLIRKIFINSLVSNRNFGAELITIIHVIDSVIGSFSDHDKFNFSNN